MAYQSYGGSGGTAQKAAMLYGGSGGAAQKAAMSYGGSGGAAQKVVMSCGAEFRTVRCIKVIHTYTIG